VLALGFLAAGSVLGGSGDPPDRALPAAGSPAERGSIKALQARLERLPGDYTGWSALGLLYVEQARLTADPSFYPKAQAALERSLEVRPEENSDALTGMAALQVARHEFPEAEGTARQAIAINAFDASAYGILADALNELGRYEDSATALQKMADLKPTFTVFARASYARELRGDVDGARKAMEQALEMSFAASDAGFALYYLGELAWNYGGDVEAAAARYDQGLNRDSTSLPLQAAAAKVAAARGDTEQALRLYLGVTSRVPFPQYLLEHGELLQSLGREDEAQEQYAVVRTSNQLLVASGSIVDLEAALFEADHGTPQAALAAAEAAYAERRTVFTEDALAWALHASGRDAEALPHSQAALALGIRPASFLYHQGMINKSLGRAEDAARDLRAALETNPHFSPLQAQKARAALAELGG
jgi:tetratricopeptide (TPR) repeat protein